MNNEFKNTKWANILTMTDGINNEYWDEIAAKIEKIEELSTDLRVELDELADLMYRTDCYIKDADGDCEGIDNYQVEDWANEVAEIENNFWFEED